MKRCLMRVIFVLVAIPVVAFSATASKEKFLKNYTAAAKEMVPTFQTTSCKVIPSKSSPGKNVTSCRMGIGNSLLSVDGLNDQVTGVWLMLDATQLDHPSDLIRSGGMLLRAMRGSSYGDYLAVSTQIFSESKKRKWQKYCAVDKESSSEFCVSSDDGVIFDLVITRQR